MILDKEEFDKAIQEAETRGYWKSVNQLYEDKGSYYFKEVGKYHERVWRELVEDIRRGRKHK